MFDFESIAGRDKLIKSLQRQISDGAISHAYIFSGERGIGKKTLGYTFAKAILCENKTACGHCKSCITFESGNNPDIIKLTLGDNKSIGVDEIREQIVAMVFIKPYLYDKKVYIVEDACKLTTQAQNAFLKTLEEAQAHAVFILLCENDKLMLPTIISRCRVTKLKSLPQPIIKTILSERLALSEADSSFFSALSAGNPGLALEFATSESFSKIRHFVVYDVLHKLYENDLPKLFSLAKAFEEFKPDIELIFDIMLLWYRDLSIITQLGADRVIQSDLIDLLSQNNMPLDALSKKADIIRDARIKLNQNTAFQLTLEVMLIKLSENE